MYFGVTKLPFENISGEQTHNYTYYYHIYKNDTIIIFKYQCCDDNPTK